MDHKIHEYKFSFIYLKEVCESEIIGHIALSKNMNENSYL